MLTMVAHLIATLILALAVILCVFGISGWVPIACAAVLVFLAGLARGFMTPSEGEDYPQ